MKFLYTITYPTTLDTLSNPSSTDNLENVDANLDHDKQHSNANDAIEALEAKVGADSSAVTTSHDYKLGEVTSGDKAVGKTATQTLTNKTLTSPILNLSSNATGDMYYRKADGTLERLPIGSTGNILAVSSGGVPEYIANPSGVIVATTPIVRTYLNAVSPATWTKPAGLKYIEVEVQAGGAGTRNVSAPSGSGDNADGGGAGGYSKKIISAALLGSNETITIGAGGAIGSPGGSSSFGSHCSANGGSGKNGGTATGGDINITGGQGDNKITFSDDVDIGGRGGDSILGFGGGSVSDDSDANNGGLYGGGAGGASVTNGSKSGGVGGAGIVIIKEYYNY